MCPRSLEEIGRPGQKPFRTLLFRLRSLGDTVLMTPVATVLKRLPGSHVGVVIEHPYEQILKGNPHIDQLFVLDNQPNKWAARWRILRQIRAFDPDLAIDLHGGTTSALLTALSGAPKRAGYRRSRSAFLYNIRVPDSRQVWDRPHVHTVEHQLSTLKHLGFPVEPVPPLSVPVAQEDVRWVRAELEVRGAREGFVLVHPAAAFDTKQWAVENFSSLAGELAEKGHSVVATSGPGENHLLEKMRANCPPEVQFIDPLNVSRFAALVSLCGLYIGNDTGATHIAAALKRRIVVVFGSSNFRVWYPWESEHRLIRSDLPCMPCPGYYCLHFDEPRCIRSIPVERVLEAALSLV